jgi:hypothetical protein
MRAAIVIALAVVPQVVAQTRDYPRNIFETAQPVTGATPFPDYKPERLGEFYGKRHEVELQMFDLINEAALRRDKSLDYYLKLYGSSLGYIPSLAAAHYKWVFGDKKQLDWLIAEDRKHGWGADSLTMTVFAYMDEWDKTIRALKARDAYLRKGEGGATDEILYRAIEIRKQLYGAERFQKAWDAAKIK